MSIYKKLFIEALKGTLTEPVVMGAMVINKKSGEKFQVEKVANGKVTMRNLASKTRTTIDQGELQKGDYILSTGL